MADPITFIKKDGRVIPIRAPGGASSVAHRAGKVATGAAKAASVGGAAHGLKKAVEKHKSIRKNESVKVNGGLDALGLGLSVASGAVAAATFGMGAKGFFAGSVASHAIDVGGVAAAAGSVAGKGNTKARVKEGARREARNFAVGNGVYLAGLVGFKKNRQAVATYAKSGVSYAKKGLGYAQKVLSIGRKALRVG